MKAILVWLILLYVGVANAQTGDKRGPSTPEERERFVKIVHKLEQSPLDKNLYPERAWALQWLVEVPDINVDVCTAPLGDFMKSNYKYASLIEGQFTFSMGVFVIEHLGKPADDVSSLVAGVEGALNAYKSILKSDPDAGSKALDNLLTKQRDGKLADFVRDSSKKGCKQGGDQVSSYFEPRLFPKPAWPAFNWALFDPNSNPCSSAKISG